MNAATRRAIVTVGTVTVATVLVACSVPEQVAPPYETSHSANDPPPVACLTDAPDLCPELAAWQALPASPCVRLGLDACAVPEGVELPPSCFLAAPCSGAAEVACCRPDGEPVSYACDPEGTASECPPYECMWAKCVSGACEQGGAKPDGAPCLGDGSVGLACVGGSCAKP